MSDSLATLRPVGRFDFGSYRQFRDTYEPALEDPKISAIVVDLSDVQYIDSAALGVLLLLRDKATAAGKKVSLANPKGTVKEVLEIANFSKLFQIA